MDWVEHLETVNHTAACRHLRSKYPNWKPKVSSREYGGRTADHKRHSTSHPRSTSWSPPPHPDKPRGLAYKPRGKAYAPHHVPRHNPYSKDVDGRFERPHTHSESNLRRPFREHWEKREMHEGSSRMYLKRPHYDPKRLTSHKEDHLTKKTLMKSKSSLKSDTKHAEGGPPAKKKKVAAPMTARDPECLVYLTDIPKEATEQEVINLAGSFGVINNVLMMPLPDEDELKDQCQQASVCMMKAEDAQTFANAPNLLIRDRVITASVAKVPEEGLSSEADGAGSDQVPEKKGVVVIEDLPESGWTEDDLKALAEPFGYLDDVIAAKQIGKALLLFPDTASAGEMVKVHAFSPLTINGHKLNIKHFIRSISIHTPVALYNCFMQSEKPKGTTWSLLIVVSNVPQTPSAASVVHKLVSRIGTVCRSLAIKNMVICEMANGPLGTAVWRHYLKFPCMIQNNPLVFTRKPDPKPASKVIPAFLDTDKDVAEVKNEAEVTGQNETGGGSEAQEPTQQNVEVKSEPAEAAVTEKEETKEAKETVEQVSEEAEGAEVKPEDVSMEEVRTEAPCEPSEEAAVEGAEGEETTETPPKENGTHVQPTEEDTAVTKPQGEASAPEAVTETKETKALSAEPKPQVKPPKKTPALAKKQASVEQSKETSKSNGQEERERRERESRDRDGESRGKDKLSREKTSRDREREFWDKEREKRDRERRERDRERENRDRERRERERGRKEREHEERSKRDYDRRGDPRREEWRRDWEQSEGRSTHRRGQHSRRSEHREDRHRSSSHRSTTEEDEFPFNLSDFVTVDEVGDVDSDIPIPDAPSETEPEIEATETRAGPETEAEIRTEATEAEAAETQVGLEAEATEAEAAETRVKPEAEATEAEAAETRVKPDAEVTEAEAESNTEAMETRATETGAEAEAQAEETRTEAESQPPEQEPEADEKTLMEVESEKPEKVETDEVTEVKAEEPEPTLETETKEPEVAEVKEQQQTTAGDESDITEEPCPAAVKEETNQEEPSPKQDDLPEVKVPSVTAKSEENMEEEEAPAAEKEDTSSEKQETEMETSASPAAELEKSENGEKHKTEKLTSDTLPPFNPNNSVGLEYLVPMTGFFCKVCSRFFTGAKDTQLSHSKSLKHYENLEKFLKNRQSSASSADST